MSESFDLSRLVPQASLAMQALRNSNALSERYGLTLTDTQIQALLQARNEILVQTGRVEFGEGVLSKLVYAFCDSPYVTRDAYASTLGTLQELFYTLKNESEDTLSDDELIQAMQLIYNNKAQGALEYLDNVTVAELFRALGGNVREDEYSDDDMDDGEY